MTAIALVTKVILPSGKELDPNADIIGLGEDLEVWHGHDGVLIPNQFHIEEVGYEPWSDEDKLFIGQMMVIRWARYIAKIKPEF